MLDAIWEQVSEWLALGLDPGDVNAGPMALRTLLIYVFTLAIVRLGSKRFLSEASAFDVIVAIMLGSVMSRAINGSAPFFPTLIAGVVLLGLHWLFATLAFRVNWFGPLVKGNPVLLVRDGEIQWDGMWRAGLSLHDLEAALRLKGHEPDVSKVRLAYLERSGQISVIRQKEPRAFVAPVEEGARTVRIEVE